MKIAPLIHSRTLHCDFNPRFAVRATDVDFNWAMKKVLLSTTDIDILNGARYLVASNGQICIAGIACKLRFFAENYLSGSDAEDAKNYFHDERGREIKIFLGFSFKDGNKNEIPDVNYSTLWKFFKENLAPEWEHTTSKTVEVNYETCQTKNFSDKVNFTSIGEINFCESNEGIDEKLFLQCMAERKNLCTNVDQMKIINSGEFEIISTSQSLINRFKSASEKKTPAIQSTQKAQETSANSQQHKVTIQRQQKNQKSPPVGLIIIVVFVILFAVVFLLMN